MKGLDVYYIFGKRQGLQNYLSSLDKEPNKDIRPLNWLENLLVHTNYNMDIILKRTW